MSNRYQIRCFILTYFYCIKIFLFTESIQSTYNLIPYQRKSICLHMDQPYPRKMRIANSKARATHGFRQVLLDSFCISPREVLVFLVEG